MVYSTIRGDDKGSLLYINLIEGVAPTQLLSFIFTPLDLIYKESDAPTSALLLPCYLKQ